jgi:hypothetical protein
MLADLRLPDPKHREVIELLNDFAVQMRAQGRFETARVALERAKRLDPLVPEVWANLGCVFMSLGRHDEARAAMERSVALAPTKSDWWGNLGILYGAMRLYEASERAFAKCVDLAEGEANRIGARWDRSLQRLELGEWEAAWPDYEARRDRKPDLYPKSPYPAWTGEPLDGLTLYVQMEQGIGDVILFSRYLAEVHRRWPTAKILFTCHDKLVSLLWGFRAFVEFLPGGVPWPKAIDYSTYLMSIPGVLGSTPKDVPADPGLIRARVEPEKARFNFPEPHLGGLKVGIAWTGNPTQDRNHERSIPLGKLLTLAEDPDVTLYSLQVGPGEEDIDQLGAAELVYPFGPLFADQGLVCAASAMLHLDLVITVCTSTAHLAGALGMPTWTLLCHDPYWVWMQGETGGDDTLWYPNMRLYRQPAPGNWDVVLQNVKTDLKAMLTKRRHAIRAA